MQTVTETLRMAAPASVVAPMPYPKERNQGIPAYGYVFANGTRIVLSFDREEAAERGWETLGQWNQLSFDTAELIADVCGKSVRFYIDWLPPVSI